MYFFNIKPYTDQYFTYYYMMSANWVSVKIMVPSECCPTGFLPTARPPVKYLTVKQCVCGVIARVTSYVIFLFWRPFFHSYFKCLIMKYIEHGF